MKTKPPPTESPPQEKTSFLRRIWTKIICHHDQPPLDFANLYSREMGQLGDAQSGARSQIQTSVAGEPWVKFTPSDRFGLALSGGGIRSATFNLGFAQALAHLGILKEVDYLSSVSGGGYFGGFWMAWLQRNQDQIKNDPNSERFPLGDDTAEGEPAEIRHLREFSRFLLPRVGATETELWGVAMTVLGGLIPSLLAGLATLFIGWSGWLAIIALILRHHPVGAVALGAGLAAYLILSECFWNLGNKSECSPDARNGYIGGSLFGAGMVIFAAWFWPDLLTALPAAVKAAINSMRGYFAPALLLGAETFILLLVRVVLARFFRSRKWVSVLEGFERAVARFLAISVFLLALAAAWWLAGQVDGFGVKFTAIASTAGSSAVLFAWTKKWLQSPVVQTHGSNLFQTAVKHLKRATPKILASLAWLLVFILVATAMQSLKIAPSPDVFADANYRIVLLTTVTIIALTVWLFDPARVGMHEFYRTRISRCYLGASNPKVPVGSPDGANELGRAEKNRYVIERPDDDLLLKDLSIVGKPIHLICTAANDIAGDTLGTLYRGARSAVLSANGISVGNQFGELQDLRLSSALTASAAALNSQMGRFSIDLGPAVTFLMTTLNLRLGLWVPHPKNRHRSNYRLPGRFFLRELFGLSRANGRHLHLSDGNHFENFGLYELIRRHVRYIIVSDCGADPEIVFDDLANVLRRVREDFGVEIELDITPLRPGPNGLSKQHAVVGTIHYNGIVGMDKGTIIFFKPTVTGDEPPDVLQYRTRNRAFPHESTGDQFYDEPQWESYRRLGEHVARIVLGICEPPAFNQSDTSRIDKLFLNARSSWHPAPERQEESFLAMTERCARLEGDLLADGPIRLRAEVFSEVVELAGKHPKKPAPEEEMAIMSFLLRVIQIMEDVWLSADLDHYWSHPLNQGWMSYFHRWASTGSFRRWWPIVAPIFSLGFREFAKERFKVGVTDNFARPNNERAINAARLALSVVTNEKKLKASHVWQVFEQSYPNAQIPATDIRFRYDLELLGYDGTPGNNQLPIGLAIVTPTPGVDTWTVSWPANYLFIPREYYGSGMLARFLDALIKYYESEAPLGDSVNFVKLEVKFEPNKPTQNKTASSAKPKVISQAARQERVQDIEFYKSRGFEYVEPESAAGLITLVKKIERQKKSKL
jgi:hypothetical protein